MNKQEAERRMWAERRMRIYAMRLAGATFAEIGRVMGFNRNHARQMYLRVARQLDYSLRRYLENKT